MFFAMGSKQPADVILHPQRMAILRTLASHPQTTKELGEALPGLPQATLYRHVALLHETGFVHVVSERQIRGAVSRTYALAEGAVLQGADLAAATREDHFRYFATFVSDLLGEYGRYLERPEIDLEGDGVGYRQHVLNLSDEELRELLAEVRGSIAARAGNAPGDTRIPRILATVTLPADPITPGGNS
jgi:DNA-binding transcriptional ArsR family regulator